MIAILTTFGGLFGLKGRLATALGGFLSLLILSGILWGAKAMYDASVVERHNAEAILEAERLNAAAAEKAAAERLADERAVNKQEVDLRNAIADTPDTVPDAVRIRLGCQRLHRANPGAELPAACRPGG